MPKTTINIQATIVIEEPDVAETNPIGMAARIRRELDLFDDLGVGYETLIGQLDAAYSDLSNEHDSYRMPEPQPNIRVLTPAEMSSILNFLRS